ncbi:pyruvate dehydrogenase E2 component (dihydrolipoamide acetyltransferase) [Rhodovulum bhavnagarense]|uniref:Acetyltransferase component of pyruvate dehydrogenase complex n=1 Tax=Rhodovulum bhavnagarense TaxID=992286 RepID=A0A4R2RIG5_9RHOB|nr:pyruvate dehydrogenase complex dihydrolipoamide acetyltransferase [Rhodovulum bhavnagarense]TCP61937.1 pyruvate dehydrogenase E2 component (dihydrolipoamide acetyltransferase) [Rhodovulum bhavnagarense]
MPTEILMPALSPTMEDGTLAKWLVNEGDSVAAGDLIAEIETDKATMEFEASDDGVIGKLLVDAGTEGIKVNTPIALLLGESEKAEVIKADAPMPSPAARTATATTEDKTPLARDAATTAPRAPTDDGGARILASPLARRIAAEKGLDLGRINGSGPRGRIVRADLEGATARPAPQPRSAAVERPAPASMPAGPDAESIMAIYAERAYSELPLDGMRKTIAARLTEAKQTIPHFYLRRDIRLDALLAFRAQFNRQLEKRGVKLSVNDFIIKACALALQQVPAANAVWAGDRILRLVASDVAVAVAIEGGLFTPVLRDAETKTLGQLSAEMKDLAARARDKKLAPNEYQGGSFAISNLGMFGIDSFDAVINPPHGAILAVGAGVKKAVVTDDGQIEPATVMSATLSVDHRVIDGAVGAELLAAIKENLENPMAMLA